MKAMVSKPYAKVLKEAFPKATFVGFTELLLLKPIKLLVMKSTVIRWIRLLLMA